MTRKPYILKEEEINTLVRGIVDHGDEETYSRMRDKSLVAMKSDDDVDEMLMDMHETMLNRARGVGDGPEYTEVKKTLYQLASMLRILAHYINKEYRASGKKKSGERFLKLASYNKDAPVT